MSSPEEHPSFKDPSSPIGRVQSGLAASIHFESGNNVQANLPNNNMNKVRWTQGEHMIFMQEYEKYGNNYMQKIFFHRCEVGGRNIYPAKPTSTHSYCFCWVRCRHCNDYEARGASGNYEAWGAKWQGIMKLT